MPGDPLVVQKNDAKVSNQPPPPSGSSSQPAGAPSAPSAQKPSATTDRATVFIGIAFGIAFLILSIAGVLYVKTHTCPASCNDNNFCTKDICSSETKYKCQHAFINDCCGNTRCEFGEDYATCSADCPNCDDDNKCTKDSYDYHGQTCRNVPILMSTCCGNTVCEISETYQSCPRDCPNCDDDNTCTKDAFDYHRKRCINEAIIPCCGNKICDEGVETRANCSRDCPSCEDNNRLTADSFNYKTQKCDNIVTHYFIEDFESGLANWRLNDSQGKPTTTLWFTVKENGNTVLKGKEHNWADLLGKQWDDHIAKMRIKVVKGGLHINYRLTQGASEPNRYFVWAGTDGVNLRKQLGEKFYELVNAGPSLTSGWNTVEIRGYKNTLNVLVNGNLLIKYKDTNTPILSGGFALESLDNSEILIDDVEIKVIAEKDVTYP